MIEGMSLIAPNPTMNRQPGFDRNGPSHSQMRNFKFEYGDDTKEW